MRSFILSQCSGLADLPLMLIMPCLVAAYETICVEIVSRSCTNRPLLLLEFGVTAKIYFLILVGHDAILGNQKYAVTVG